MACKFLLHDASGGAKLHPTTSSEPADPSWPPAPFREVYFFFYGTLMDPPTLARVLQLSEPPHMRPARVIGYQIKLWGQYPALVDDAFHPVDGLACKILSRESWDRLVAYGSDKYKLGPIYIDFLDTGEEEVEGVAFEWNANPKELQDGSFSLENWLQEQNVNRSY
ncbi:hypothetical protein PENVUL_c029G07589 [Penicillium vulpinum]|uniref:Putative gamma-glutamylcyclotransferase n=1 Tax=Penicillium vulpinum TaxID=29845 RepID=A0A1V6RSY6_9EURO|nr:hypothetical protein PENVUL_c029G07589 [Penicillium vulpinum]